MTTRQDDLLHLYEEASALQDERPASGVQSAILAHAALQARSRNSSSGVRAASRPAANWPSWKTSLAASILLVPLVGILVQHRVDEQARPDKIAAMPSTQAPLAVPQADTAKAAPAAPVVPAVPAAPAPAKTALADAAPKAVEVPPPTIAAVDQSATQGNLGRSAETMADNRADRSEAKLARSRETAPALSSLVAPAAPAAAPAPMAKSLAGAGSVAPPSAPIVQAVIQGDVQRVQRLLKEGASPDTRDAQGRTLLMLAVIGGHETLVRRLIEQGANAAALDPDGLTALQLARKLGLVAIAGLLE